MSPSSLPFKKMHGLGNDFLILDQRKSPAINDWLTPKNIRQLCHRSFGLGCDQLIVLTHSPHANVHMTIFNQDGTPAEACGNATRCVALLLFEETQIPMLTIETNTKRLSAYVQNAQHVEVDMGEAVLEKNHPAQHTTFSPLLPFPIIVTIGNPHCIFFVPNIEEIPFLQLGPKIEKHALFPKGINVSFAQQQDPETIRLLVWERGAGATLACGTAAVAAVFGYVKIKGIAPRQTVLLPGGSLTIHVEKNDHVRMTGPAQHIAEGIFFMGDKPAHL